jgi:hypothetical protein
MSFPSNDEELSRRRAKFEVAYAATGKRYDCAKSCVRFRRLEELPLEVVGDAVAWMPVEKFVEVAKAVRVG